MVNGGQLFYIYRDRVDPVDTLCSYKNICSAHCSGPTWPTPAADFHLDRTYGLASSSPLQRGRSTTTTMSWADEEKQLPYRLWLCIFYDNKDFPFELISFFGVPGGGGVITFYL